VVFAARVRRLRRTEEDVLIHVAALERVRLVHLRQVVAELRRVAEPLADHPARVSQITEVARPSRVAAAYLQEREASFLFQLRDPEDAVASGYVAVVVAVRLQPDGVVASDP